MKVPSIDFWRTRIDGTIFAVHACRRWDRPSNGVFMLVTRDELWGPGRIDWMGELARRLSIRERRLFALYGRYWKDYLTEFFDDEVWCAL
jgi:hypothetical protein